MADQDTRPPARIAVIGTGWWGQGWHLPQLHRNCGASVVAAIVDTNSHPTSSINPKLLSLEALGALYGCPTYSSVDALLASGVKLDGAIVSTPHATHFEVRCVPLGAACGGECRTVGRPHAGTKPTN